MNTPFKPTHVIDWNAVPTFEEFKRVWGVVQMAITVPPNGPNPFEGIMMYAVPIATPVPPDPKRGLFVVK